MRSSLKEVRMLRAVAAAIALLALPAFAADGFFRHQESSVREQQEVGFTRAQALVCSMVVRYELAQPAAQEITFEGPQGQCLGAYDKALTAVLTAKSTGPWDPLLDGPVHECAIIIGFAPDLVNPPLVSVLGAGGCAGSVSTALAATKQNVACTFHCAFGH